MYMDFSIINQHAAVDSTVRPHRVSSLFLYPLNAVHTAGEICTDWQTWGQYLNIQFILGRSLLHSLVYVALAVRIMSAFQKWFSFGLCAGGVCWECCCACADICALVSRMTTVLLAVLIVLCSAFHTGSECQSLRLCDTYSTTDIYLHSKSPRSKRWALSILVKHAVADVEVVRS